MLQNSIFFQQNYLMHVSNLLISKYNFLTLGQFPKLKKIKLIFFFKSKKHVLILKNAMFLVGFCNLLLKMFKSTFFLRGVIQYIKHTPLFSIFYQILVFRELLTLSNVHVTYSTVSVTSKTLFLLLLLFENPLLQENLSKKF